MKKYVLVLLLLIIPELSLALSYPKTNSKVVEIYDLTDNKVLYEIDSNKKSSIASLTKIITTITAIENIDNLDEKVTVTSDILNTVRWDASRAGLQVGDIVTYKDLLYASILPSGADATNTLAISISGSVDNFVEKMNDAAKKIGANDTHFVNVTGLDDINHYSTANDIIKILRYALNNDLFKTIYTTREYTLSNGLEVQSTIKTYNKNNSIDTSKIIGSKTGFTLDAGYCLSSLSKIKNHDIITIVLNADHIDNTYYNIKDTIDLIGFIEKNYNEETLVSKNQLIKTIPVKLSKIDNVNIYASKDITKFLPNDYNKDNIKIESNCLNELSFKNKIGDKIGTINYYYENELLFTQDVILNEKINISLLKIIKEYYYVFIILIILLLSFILLLNKTKSKKLRHR